MILIQQSTYMLSAEHLHAYLCASVILFGNIYIFKVKHLLKSLTSLCFISGYWCSLVLRDLQAMLNLFSKLIVLQLILN